MRSVRASGGGMYIVAAAADVAKGIREDVTEESSEGGSVSSGSTLFAGGNGYSNRGDETSNGVPRMEDGE